MSKKGIFLAIFGLLLFSPLTKSYAVPSFTRQTGMSCNDCHTVFPELTPAGRDFKLAGYVWGGDKKREHFIPVSARLLLSFSDARDLTGGVAPFDSTDKNKTNRAQLPQQLNVYYGGKIYDNIGGLVQVSYFGNTNSTFLDNSDIRYANSIKLMGKDLVYGLTINNNPTQQDVWNSTPAWGFPYNASNVALTPAASPIITRLGEQVGGIGAYGYWNDLIYLEGSVYRTTRNGITMPFGAGSTPPGTVVDGPVPYWRAALQHGWKEHYISVGTYGIAADVFPAGSSNGPTDRFTDIAFDAQYQYISDKHVVSLATTFINEKQRWDASLAQGLTQNLHDSLNTFRANLNYYYRSNFSVGGTVAYFATNGTADPVLYAPSQFTGSGSGKPNSNGIILEADYLPWNFSKFGLQYTIYNKFNGGGTNYDGFGSNASRNNTLYVFTELAF